MIKKFLAMVAGLLLLASLATAADSFTGVYGTGPDKFTLATGSPGELGLLKALAEGFNKTVQGKATLQWIKAGSGKSLQLLKDKKVDMIMVHAPAAEKKAVQEGWATDRTLIGSNEFFIVGPAQRPGQNRRRQRARRTPTAASPRPRPNFFPGETIPAPIRRKFKSGRQPASSPRGDWYIITKDFMTATLKRANQEKGYFMVDSSTWTAEKKSTWPISRSCTRATRCWSTPTTPWPSPPGPPPARPCRSNSSPLWPPPGSADHPGLRQGPLWAGLYNDAAYARQYAK